MSRWIVVAPNAFKGTLSALQAARAMGRAVRRCGLEPRLVPMADGGEGTAEILAAHFHGTLRPVQTCDALGRPTQAPIADLGSHRFAVDAASACGLGRLDPADRNVLDASSYGLGLQVRAALEMGAREIILGVGGTAFVDGGAGLAVALGARLLDASGHGLAPRPDRLVDVARVDQSRLMPRAVEARWTLVLDVDNPLLGPEGAARIYGPQKGAGHREISVIERGIEKLAKALCQGEDRKLGELTRRPGTGAGGGLALAILGLFRADLKPGAQYLCKLQGLADLVSGSAAVLTGEGRLDGQTTRGKAPLCVAGIAHEAHRPVAAIVGMVEPGPVIDAFDWVEEAAPEGPPEKGRVARLVEEAAMRAMRGLGLCASDNSV